jgi:hypothetical protein
MSAKKRRELFFLKNAGAFSRAVVLVGRSANACGKEIRIKIIISYSYVPSKDTVHSGTRL